MADAISPSQKARPRVALLFADSLSAIECAWSLLAHGMEVIGVCRDSAAVPLSRSSQVRMVEVPDPARDLAACVTALKAALREEKVDVLLPLDDAAVAVTSYPVLRCRIAGPTGEHATLALDKARQFDLAADSGFDVPKTSIVRGSGEIRGLDTPVILKPRDAVWTRMGRVERGKVYPCYTGEALARAARSVPAGVDYLAQPLIDGVGRGVFGLAGAGGAELVSGHRRLRMMNPAGSGSSACVPATPSPEVLEATERFLQAASWRGLFMIELLRDASGTDWFMELNGRAWGSMALARASGYEYPAAAVEYALHGETREAGQLRSCESGVSEARHLGREIVHAAFIVRGRPPVPTAWRRRGRMLLQLLRIRRGTRWYNWQRGALGVFVADTFRTVREQARGRR